MYMCIYVYTFPNGQRSKFTQVVMTQLVPFLTLLVY